MVTDTAMKRCRLKRYNFKIKNDMSKKNKTSNKQENANSDLGNHLAEIIKECSEGMNKEQVNSQGWIWLASKKTLAESILIQFC